MIDSQSNHEDISVQPEVSVTKERFGLFSTNGEALLLSPTHEQLQTVQKKQRVEYFQYKIPGDIIRTIDLGFGDEIPQYGPSTPVDKPAMEIPLSTEDIQKLNSHGGYGAYAYQEHVTTPLADQIAYTMTSDMVGIRGIAASIDGNVALDNSEIEDIGTTVSEGSERGRKETLITTLTKKYPEIHYRTLQWLIQSPQEIRTRLTLANRSADAEKIFPVILVYDLSKLTPLGGYRAQLPEDPEDRQNAILKAYVLDYPVKNSEKPEAPLEM